MTLGPLMIDIGGLELDSEDREVLRHPLVGGVILFSRNYDSPEQLEELVADIHGLCTPPLLIATDQEGGRVQRFNTGFTQLPAAQQIGRRFDVDARQAERVARHCGWVMAAELRAVGVDFSFAPVVDLDWGMSEVVGDRAFHRNPQVVGSLANAFMVGMRKAGMVATGKHFPGHGAVAADSHEELPIDRRAYADISEDMQPYERLIAAGLPGVMAGHVMYPEVDDLPASFSRHWLQEELRERLDFRGVIFSDDLNMGAAAEQGSMSDRCATALDAGCDMVLICNNRAGVMEVLDALKDYSSPVSQIRLVRMHGRSMPQWADLRATPQWKKSRDLVTGILEATRLEQDA